MKWKPQYRSIDAWRGLAALGVVCHHVGAPVPYNFGHICVMAFFVISGYCITAAIESSARLTFRQFMWRRVRRIYPPYFFAICLFLFTRLLKSHMGVHGGNEYSPLQSPTAWVQNFTMTQWFTLLHTPTSTASSNPALFVDTFWSLNYEEQFYIVMGLLLLASSRLRTDIFTGVAAIMGLGLLWNVHLPSSCYGIFLEYWVMFGLGSLTFYRLCKAESRAARTAIDGMLLVLLAFSATQVQSYMNNEIRSVHFEWMIGCTFALTLIFLRRWDDTFCSSRPGKALCSFGLITYSLYLTHDFNIRLVQTVGAKLVARGVPELAALGIEIAILCSIATVFWYFCERPFVNKRPAAAVSVEPVADGAGWQPVLHEPTVHIQAAARDVRSPVTTAV